MTTAAKIDPIEPKFFKDLGAKGVKITYGPFAIPGSHDPETMGMVTNHMFNITMPCHDCLITGWSSDLQFVNGTSANANNNMWMHHTGLMNLNRTDLACEHWPERISVNGNERSPFDFTLKGTRKAGYFLRAGDEIHQTLDVMNSATTPQSVHLVVEWEFLPAVHPAFDIVVPVWLDVKGNCLNQSTGILPTDKVFTAKGPAAGWTSKVAGDLVLMVPHIHDGSTKQDVFLDGRLVCTNVPAYGETAEFVTHRAAGGGGHDHGGAEGGHVYHVSSVSQCEAVGKVVPGSRFTIQSAYDMVLHEGSLDHHGEPEPIMAIEFLYIARPQAEAMKDILAMGPGDLKDFTDQVRGLKTPKEP
ncbi:hypothetical protein B0T18DRAFT_314162 [Schizothecium vesticola]|uniref:Uncharacterized protein n=1 Tax=Schizothecium vesticola TaxID=314040 RepID=A0AA40F7P6_9PEZI|nr:hypothetical protein B0T18DRAFT_314162 [Schizothecium vesticola]